MTYTLRHDNQTALAGGSENCYFVTQDMEGDWKEIEHIERPHDFCPALCIFKLLEKGGKYMLIGKNTNDETWLGLSITPAKFKKFGGSAVKMADWLDNNE